MRDQDKRQAVRLMLIGTFLLWFSVYTYPSFLAVYAQEAGAKPVLVGAIIGSYGLLQLILRIPAGIYSDMLKKRKPFMLVGMLAAFFSAIGFYFLKSPVGLLISRGMAGVAATTWVVFSVLYSSLFDDSELTAAMGRISAVQYGAQLIAMLSGGYLAQRLSYDASFLLAAAAGAIGFICVLKIRDRASNEPPRTLFALVSALRNRSLLISTGLSMVFHFVCWGTILGFTASWARDIVKMDNAALGVLSAMYLLPNLIVPLFTGKLARMFGMRIVIAAGFIINACACFLFGHCYTAPALYAVQMLFGFGMALMLPLFISGAIADVKSAERGAAMGFYQSIYSVGMFLGPLFSGLLIERFSDGGPVMGYAANFYAMAGISLAGMLLAVIFYRKDD